MKIQLRSHAVQFMVHWIYGCIKDTICGVVSTTYCLYQKLEQDWIRAYETVTVMCGLN